MKPRAWDLTVPESLALRHGFLHFVDGLVGMLQNFGPMSAEVVPAAVIVKAQGF